MKIVTNKIYSGKKSITIDQYHEEKEHSSSTRLKEAHKSMAHYFEYESSDWKAHFDFGHVAEMMLLEPEEDWKYVVFDPEKRPDPESDGFRSKVNKEWKANFMEENQEAGNLIISKEDLEKIKIMVSNARKNQNIVDLIKGSQTQPSIFWTDPETGIKLKTRPDLWKGVPDSPDEIIIVDVKTADDGSPDGFGKQMVNLNYPFQGLMQKEGAEFMTKKTVALYVYIVLEKKKPYNATTYVVPNEEFEKVNPAFRNMLKRLAKAQKDGYKNDYANEDNGVNGWISLKLPFWYVNKFDKYEE